MTPHVMKDDLARLRDRGLTAVETLAIVRHLETCSECSATAADAVDPRAAADLWSASLQESLGDHLRADELCDYVDGIFSPAAMREADAHREHCTVCRDDVADLRRLRAGGSRRWLRVALSAAAVLLVLGALVRRAPTKLATAARPPLSVSSVRARADLPPAAWRALVDAAVDSGRIAPPPILATLRVPIEATRGLGAVHTFAVTPNGVMIDDPRPTFRWSGVPGAVFCVSVFFGDREVARSAPLRHELWTPERDLERGRTYRWQVEARRGDRTWIIPRAPQPAPLFALLDDAAHRELDSAHRLYPGDHLLLGVLAAHHGLQEAASGELTLHHALHPDARSAALLDSVRAWRSGAPQ
ncbi:MAG: hypothetical protein ABI837_05325 [Acidobacteriota bacterium]